MLIETGAAASKALFARCGHDLMVQPSFFSSPLKCFNALGKEMLLMVEEKKVQIKANL